MQIILLRRFPGQGGGGGETTVALSTRAIFSVFADYFSETLEMASALLYSVVSFSVILVHDVA